MARDPREIITALLSKTVANGCTPEEAKTARAKAEELSTKYGIPLQTARPRAQARPHVYQDEYRSFDEEMLRRMQERMQREFGPGFKFNFGAEGFMHSAGFKARQQGKTQEQKAKVPKFASIRECAEYWLDPKWTRKHDGKRLSHSDVANLVRRSFPDARTSAASVGWYASQMNKAGRR